MSDELPHEMQIVTPPGTFSTWAESLLHIGYCFVDYGGFIGYDPYIQRVHKFTSPNGNASVVIVESRKTSILQAMFNFGLTSEMTLLDTSRLYCFYPKLLNENLTISAFRQPRPTTVNWWISRSVTHYDNTAHWTKACRSACLAIWRHTDGFQGIGEFAWGGIDNDKDIDGNMGDSSYLRSLRLKWRIGIHCANDRCPYNSHFYGTLSEIRDN
ncbi:hypothetical protein Hypma_006074 [Hypsizygus marmoreus]|uniref:Uncharacterized protein n=1 Tax=Hypsizygus marmoreus TaxID=39966 RepID=A0A369K0Y7_HYPMA|nr:hypothetical protein Hypma_006074 [Hypsizygus marmoreus]